MYTINVLIQYRKENILFIYYTFKKNKNTIKKGRKDKPLSFMEHLACSDPKALASYNLIQMHAKSNKVLTIFELAGSTSRRLAFGG